MPALTHAWVHETVPPTRVASLGRDAHEGYCELIAPLLAGAENDRVALVSIEKNTYTRGQIQLFVSAEQRFGMNDVVDRIKYGVNTELRVQPK